MDTPNNLIDQDFLFIQFHLMFILSTWLIGTTLLPGGRSEAWVQAEGGGMGGQEGAGRTQQQGHYFVIYI